MEALKKELTMVLLMCKSKEEEENVKMVIDMELIPEYISDEESILRSIAKNI